MGIFGNYFTDNKKNIDNNWVKWFHFGVPDEEGPARDSVRNMLAMLMHCKPCTALSGCYFAQNNMPKSEDGISGTLHNNCDCSTKPISNIETKAFCPIEKFTKYIFSGKYSANGKGTLFNLLGFTSKDSVWLKTEYERQAQLKYSQGEYIIHGRSQYGQDINITIEMPTPIGKIVQFISGWKVHPLGLITCNTPLADR